MLKAAIVGCGGIAQVHGKVLQDFDGAELVACADIIPERAEKLAATYGGKAYTSLEEMLENEDVDVLHICTPHYLHTPMMKYAVEKGLKVFCEKPPAMTFEQWDEFKTAAKDKDVAICFQNRYNQSVQHIKKLIDSGVTGAIKGIRAFVTWSRGESYYVDSGWRGSLKTEGGGILINQSIHTLDLMIYLAGAAKWADASCCNHHLKGVIEVEDMMEALINFGDFSGLFYATTAYSTDSPVMVEFSCENCFIRMEEKELTVRWNEDKTEHFCFDESENGVGKSYWGSGHHACISDFYNHISAGKKAPINPDNCDVSIRTMLSMYKSARETHDKVNI